MPVLRAGVDEGIPWIVKPANVLLDSLENAYLTDFGIAELLEGTTCLTQTLAAARIPAGTVHYMAPEQARGAARSAGPFRPGLCVSTQVSFG